MCKTACHGHFVGLFVATSVRHGLRAFAVQQTTPLTCVTAHLNAGTEEEDSA